MKLKGTSISFSVRFISSEPQTKASFESRCAGFLRSLLNFLPNPRVGMPSNRQIGFYALNLREWSRPSRRSVKKSFVETDRASQLHVLACTAAHRVSAGLTWRPHACTTLNDDVSPRALQIRTAVKSARRRTPPFNGLRNSPWQT
jgi:hypothetical protein